MDVTKVDDDLWEYDHKGLKLTIKAGVSAKPDPDNEYHSVRYTVYHIYDQDGIYVSQAKNLKGDFERAIRDYKNKLA